MREDMLGGLFLFLLGMSFILWHKKMGAVTRKLYKESFFKLDLWSSEALGIIYLLTGIFFSIVGVLMFLKII